MVQSLKHRPSDEQEQSANLTADSDCSLEDKLRQAFSPIMDEPIPPRFLELVEKLADRNK